MKLKRYIDFINEAKQDQWIHEGDFDVTDDMIQDGRLIKDKIPDVVTGNFHCSNKKLTSLEGAPKQVGGYFDCEDNVLTSLEGAPKQVAGSFHCNDNQLTTLQGAPEKVGEYFDCNRNQLTTLEGAPKQVGGDFNCRDNQLTSLEGSPIGVKLWCDDNKVNLDIEKEFIESGSYQDRYGYWIGLLNYMIKKNIPLEEVEGWPEGFLNDNLKKSAKGTVKYKL